MSAIEAIQRNLMKTILFLEPLMPIVNSHMVNFITHSLYEGLIPQKIRDDVKTFGFEKCLNMLFDHCNNKKIEGESDIGQVLNSIQEIHFNNRTVDYYTLVNFKNFIYDKGCKKFDVVPFEEFMSGKKHHEVTLMSSLIAELSDLSQNSVIVDIGDGKGYLSSFLALEYQLKVLGIDSSGVKTKGAAKRDQRLRRVWKGTRKKYIEDSYQDKEDINSNSVYRQVTEFISETTDVSEIIRRELGDKEEGFGLVGLHTCGDLSPACLRLFVEDPSPKFLVNVGCCYHLLTGDSDEHGFPLSKYLRSGSFRLSRNARMASLKPKWKIGSTRTVPNEFLLYRAILQKILIDKQNPERLEAFQVGRIASKCSSFSQYIRMALEKLKLNIEVSDAEIEVYLKEFSCFQHQSNFYFMFLTCLSSLVEDIILLDKLLYLKEQGLNESYLVEMFDPVVSPRSHAIIAFRK